VPRSLLVSEIFGPTFQGEGPSSGQLAAFLRLGGCNLNCTWCDTPYTWDRERFDLERETVRLTSDEVLKRLQAVSASLIVVTGGEPLLQQLVLEPVLEACLADGRSIEVETNGTIMPSDHLMQLVTRFNVSPKLGNSGVRGRHRLRQPVLRALVESGSAIFKFVVERASDLDEIAAVEGELDLRPIWVMPQAQTPEQVMTVMRDIAAPVLARGWNLTTRLHVLLWGAARGR
jgi:7-carboxy-7-deazaguanine synthase